MKSVHPSERLTAAGRGAVAVIRAISSDGAIIDRHFLAANGQTASTASIGRVLFGKWGDEELVVVRTAQDKWEINCHGGEAAVHQIQTDLGGQIIDSTVPDQSLSGRITNLILQCRSRRTVEYLLAQREGILADFLDSVTICDNCDDASKLVANCLQWTLFAAHLTVPWNITIAGRPNAGKSSLLNAMIGYQRAIVFDQPGTTRDRIEAELLLDGWPMSVTDTAGIRATNDEIESSGVAASYSSLHSCDLCLLVVDSTCGWSEQDADILNLIPSNIPIAVLLNKTDLSGHSCDDLPNCDRTVSKFLVSATSGQGIEELLKWIPSTLVPEVPILTQPLPVLPELESSLQQFLNDQDLACLQRKLQGAIQQSAKGTGSKKQPKPN